MNSKRNLIVVGSDTSVGKTFVACALARALAEHGVNVAAIKPVETGVDEEVSPEEDGAMLAEATGQATPTHALTRLKAPLAPPVAADLEGVHLDMEDWVRTIRQYIRKMDLAIVEGAGGFLSPLTWNASARTLGIKLEARAILVVGNRLGCVNHTLLTLEALEQGRIPLVATILNGIGADDESVETNLETIKRFSGIERIVALPHLNDWKEAAVHLKQVAKWVLK